MVSEKIDKAVNQFGKAVVSRARANLTKEKGIASRSLWSSIRYRFSGGRISFIMELYGAFLDKGVSGTGKLQYNKNKYMPVPYNKSEADPEYSFKSRFMTIGGSLKEWLQAKGLDESLDYVMRRSIHAKGIRPRRFFTNAFDVEMRNFDKQLGQAITDTIELHLDNLKT